MFININTNINYYNDYYIIYNNDIITADLYLPQIREDRTWMGDLEISIIYKIYDYVMYVFELTNNNTTVNLINIYGTDDNPDKILLNLYTLMIIIILYFMNQKEYII